MKRMIFVAVILLALSEHALAMSTEERVEDAHTIINIFTQQYGPIKWKEENLGINFKDLADGLINDAKAATTDKDFYRAVSKFISSFQDAHLSYKIPSSKDAYLPFDTEYFSDGVIVTKVWYRNFCTDEELEKHAEDCHKKSPIHAGDRVLAIDGVSVNQIIDQLAAYKSDGYAPANRKYYGGCCLTYRSQKKFPDIPTGQAIVTIVDAASGEQKDLTLEWKVRGFEVAEVPPKSAIYTMTKAMGAGDEPVVERANGESFIEKINNSQREANAWVGDVSPVFPMWTDFKVHMNDPYFVGTFEAGGKRIGFLRLATWHNDSWKWDIKQLEKEIEYLNNNTDALVIDQTDNGGGSPCYMNSVASFFITEQKNEMKMQMRANRTWLAQVEDWYDKSMGEEKIHATAWVESLHKAVESGNFLSDPVPICNPVGKIMPHRNSDGNLVLYTKPVLLLINELDYSAADMFAAVMKDWGVATLFGTRTVGAGGYVMETSLIGNSELTLWMTTSLLYRENSITLPNGKATHYIENVGVEPDIKYERTLKDYLDGYQDYRAAIETAVVGLIFN